MHPCTFLWSTDLPVSILHMGFLEGRVFFHSVGVSIGLPKSSEVAAKYILVSGDDDLIALHTFNMPRIFTS